MDTLPTLPGGAIRSPAGGPFQLRTCSGSLSRSGFFLIQGILPGRKKEAALRPEVTQRRAGQRGGRVLGSYAVGRPGAGSHAARGTCAGSHAAGRPRAGSHAVRRPGAGSHAARGTGAGSHAAGGCVHICLLPRCILLHGSPCARLPALPARLTRMKAGSCRNEIWDSESAPSLVYLSAVCFPPVTDWCSKDLVFLLHQ